MYIAANLTPESIQILKEKLPPKYSRVFYHHMTIAYNPNEEILNKYKNLKRLTSLNLLLQNFIYHRQYILLNYFLITFTVRMYSISYI